MSRAQAIYLTADEIREIALPKISEALGQFGATNIEVREEKDFDGDYVFKIVVLVGDKVPARLIIDLSDEIQQEIRRKGEGRFVYLSTKRPEETEFDEDVE